MILIEGSRDALYQWDLNQRIVLTDIKVGTEVHFSDSHDTEEECPVLLSYEENGVIYANVPNVFLQKSGIIYVYIYIQEENKAWTEHYAEILVLPRKKPSDYVYTETEVRDWETLSKRIEEVNEKVENASIDTEYVDEKFKALSDRIDVLEENYGECETLAEQIVNGEV